MTTYPEKYLSSITNSSANRGVEAKETEIANTHLDGGAGDDAESARSACSAPAPAHSPRDCPSYLQVVVEKHRRGRAPAASSPAPASALADGAGTLSARCMGCGCGAGDVASGAVGVEGWPLGAGPPVLLACPAGAAAAHPAGTALAYYLGADVTRASAEAGGAGASAVQHLRSAEAECVEVYRFLRVGSALGAGGGGAARAAAWRRSARLRRGARAAAAELGAAARLAGGAPLWAGLLALRWTLQLARDAAAGAVHAASDYALKPALALLFNALLHPLLVFVANVLQGAHDAARPACAALGECAGHAATVLGALRLAGAAPACRCARLDHHM